MSELNIAISPAGYTTVNKESTTDSTEKKIDESNTAIATAAVEHVATAANEIDAKESPLKESDVAETIEEINSFLDNMKRNISFSIDEDLGNNVIVIKDSESDEVIRQLPSEELMVLRKKMDDVAGILFDTKV